MIAYKMVTQVTITYRASATIHSVVEVMDMGNIAPRPGIELTTLELWVSVLTTTPPRLPDVITQSILICLCSDLPERSVQSTYYAGPPGIVDL